MTVRCAGLVVALAAAAAAAAAAATPRALGAQGDAVRVQFERTGYRLTALGAKVSVSARVLDARRRAVPNTPIAYRTSNPDIAVVSAQGVVQSKRVGRTRVWAVSGRDSASALIVVDQWATTFGFAPASVMFDAIGVQQALRIQLKDAAGNAIPDGDRRTYQCRSREDRVATLNAAGQIQSKANGITWIRCADRGIADSVRVEVRQRPVRAMIVDKLAIGTRTIPDTFRLRLRAFDPKGDTIAGIRPTWASLSSSIVSIDPVSGLARAVGPGLGRIVAQVGDATDTVAVTITGTAIEGVGPEGPAGQPAATTREPSLELNPPSDAFVGDTLKLTMTARDALGAVIPNPEKDVALRSTDTSVVAVVAVLTEQRILVRSEGTAYIVARFSYAGTTITDSVYVGTRIRVGAAGATSAIARAQTIVAFVRPPRDTGGARIRNARQIDSVLKSIRESGIGRSTSGRTLAFEAIATQAKHLSQLTAATSEARSGLLFGGGVAAAPFKRLVATGAFRTGTLTPASPVGGNLAVSEFESQLAFWPSSWFGFGAGYLIRGESGDLSIERWTAVSVTPVMFRGTFVGNAVSTFAAVSIFPSSKFTGRPNDAPEKTSLAGEAGLDLRYSYLSLGFRYYVERFTFPALAGTTFQRTDQFSALRFRLGAKFGR